MSKPWSDIKHPSTLKFRFWYWYYKHIRYPYDQWRWDRAVKVIQYFDYYVVSDHEYAELQKVTLGGHSKD